MVVRIIGESGRRRMDKEVIGGVKVLVGFLMDHCFILFDELGGRVIVEQYARRR